MIDIRREGVKVARTVWGDVDPADVAGTFLVGPLAAAIATLQRTGVLLSQAYVKAYIQSELGKNILFPTPQGFAGKSWSDVQLHAALLRSVVIVKQLLAEGVDTPEAMLRGLNALLRTVALATDGAIRDSLRQLYVDRPEIIGWKRAVAGTCDKCIGKATNSTLPPGEPLDIHPNCQCVSEAVIELPPPSKALAGREMMEGGGTLGMTLRPNSPYTKQDADAGERYFGEADSFALNVQLRELGRRVTVQPWSSRPLKKLAKDLDVAMEHAGPVDTSIRVYRAVPDGPSKYGLKEGGVTTDFAFGSTTEDIGWAEEFTHMEDETTMMKLRIDPRVKAIWGANPDESELLLQRGVRYKVTSIVKKGLTWLVDADVLPPLGKLVIS